MAEPMDQTISGRRAWWRVTMGPLLVLGACSDGDETARSSAGQENDRSPVMTEAAAAIAATPIPEQDRELESLFLLAFGAPSPLKIRAPDTSRDGEYTYKPVKALEHGDQTILLSEATASDCHGCFGKLAIHYFVKGAKHPVLRGAWLDVVEGNGWGKPPEWSLRTDLTRNPALEIKTSFGNNGYDCEWVSLIEIAPDRPISRLHHVTAAFDNSGARDDSLKLPESYWQTTTSSIRARDRDHFEVVYDGSRSGVVTYTRAPGLYAPDRGTPIAECR